MTSTIIIIILQGVFAFIRGRIGGISFISFLIAAYLFISAIFLGSLPLVIQGWTELLSYLVGHTMKNLDDSTEP